MATLVKECLTGISLLGGVCAVGVPVVMSSGKPVLSDQNGEVSSVNQTVVSETGGGRFSY